PNGSNRSFIEEARRRQIVETAIGILASRGLEHLSLAEIAREAGCSKGVISYHFGGKARLMDAVLRRLLREPAAYVKTRVEAYGPAAERLAAYVEANFEFMKTHRNQYEALVDLWGSRMDDEGRNRFYTEAYQPSRRYLSHIFEDGRASGEFGNFPIETMSAVVQASIDGVMLQWVIDPDSVDLDDCKHEIMTMVNAHVARLMHAVDGGAAKQTRGA
ncbi:MAG: TetR/AcrR family transcriptional regulator, partial [Planctomycetota bacterium]|nr:TetR/AcrR family transcriptional regulator [Planctomycetota bacterium]